jgi:hypothetical protein
MWMNRRKSCLIHKANRIQGIESIRTLFGLFGETIPHVELAWLFSTSKNNAMEVVQMSMYPAEQIFGLMKTSEIIVHGYRRYGSTYIDRRFIELYTILRQIFTCVGGDMGCQLSSDEAIADCLDFLIANPPTDDSKMRIPLGSGFLSDPETESVCPLAKHARFL